MKVIIVEDEPRVRKGLSETIDWALFGLELAGTASNGVEGLELFKEQKPELVVADIRMPVMDGLAMTEAILEQKPDTRIMIISGHDEFEYAQRCIALGVTNYLLKPIGKKQFHSELEKITGDWRQHKEQREQSLELEHKLKSNLPVLRDAFLEEWLGGVSPKSEAMLRESFSFLHIPFDFDDVAGVAVFELDIPEGGGHSHADRRLLEFAINNMIGELLEDNGLSYQRGNGQTVVLYQSVSMDTPDDLILWVERVKAKLGAVLRVSVTVGLGSRAVYVQELPQLFQEALRILRLKLSFGTDLILHEGMLRPVQDQLAVLRETDEALLVHAVEMNDEAQISIVMNGLFLEWASKEELSYPDEISYQFIGLFTKLTHRLGKSIHAYLKHDQLVKWRHPEQFRSKEDIKLWWTARFIELGRSYAGYRLDRRTKVIQQVMEYIDDHIFENITREDAARHVYINSSYLSRLFKEVTGEAFSDIVLRKKMEKAMHLLQVERVMVYEVADMLGYRDPSYFARVFKKYTGKSPSGFQ
ncbi:response regulator [Paenibacillus abyssi]|nr:response regulator [Paenibacillus abyssi]